VTAEELFESPASLISWAYEDTQRFKELEELFFRFDCYEHISEYDPEFERDALRIRFIKPLPPEFRKLASHIVNDLRHALDQGFVIAARHFGWQPLKNQTVLYFPWARDEADLKGRLRNIPVEIHDIIIEHQPYFANDGGTAGSNMLRELGRIAGPNKHEAVLGSGANLRLKRMKFDWPGDWLIPYEDKMWNGAKEEFTFAYVPAGTEGKYDVDVALFVAFRDIPALANVPARNLFEAWGGYAQSIVSQLEERVAASL
jgi:hypothetical protein